MIGSKNTPGRSLVKGPRRVQTQARREKKSPRKKLKKGAKKFPRKRDTGGPQKTTEGGVFQDAFKKTRKSLAQRARRENWLRR